MTIKPQILEYLKAHPGKTPSQVARGTHIHDWPVIEALCEMEVSGVVKLTYRGWEATGQLWREASIDPEGAVVVRETDLPRTAKVQLKTLNEKRNAKRALARHKSLFALAKTASCSRHDDSGLVACRATARDVVEAMGGNKGRSRQLLAAARDLCAMETLGYVVRHPLRPHRWATDGRYEYSLTRRGLNMTQKGREAVRGARCAD